jgi:hypothetical protein
MSVTSPLLLLLKTIRMNLTILLSCKFLTDCGREILCPVSEYSKAKEVCGFQFGGSQRSFVQAFAKRCNCERMVLKSFNKNPADLPVNKKKAACKNVGE